MKTMDFYGETIKAYQDKDLEGNFFYEAINQAEELWKKEMDVHIKEHGDRGCCTLGAGIYVHYLGPRKRKPKSKRIVCPASLSSVQGEMAWSASYKKVVELLRIKGIQCWFEYGSMD